MTLLAPSPQQYAWQHLELGVFCHYGLNTFHGVEWSDGSLPADSFDPAELDASQWVRTAKEIGARYFVLTAKHHDGFCLWPSETTDYSVASSPWRGGRGDLVAEVAAACAEVDLPLGLYLSPWDRNAPCYDDPEAYDRFYQRQLTELCTRYGPLVELWFDGAGSEGRTYDWDGIAAVVAAHQPEAMVFNMGYPTIRWVGNEDGLAHDPVEYVVRRTDLSNYTQDEIELGEARYLPPECDVSLRRGWFWAAADEPKSLEHLLAIHDASIGMGANLLLNVPPDDRGLMADEDVARLREWRTALDRRFTDPVVAKIAPDGDGWVADFGRPVRLDHLELVEDYRTGQRVTGHEVMAGERLLASGQTIGNKRLHAFDEMEVSQVRIQLKGIDPVLRGVRGYRTGSSRAPQIAYLATTDEPV